MLRANYIPKYFLKFLLASIVCIVCAGWFAYDGFVAYPHKRDVALEFEKLAKEYEASEREPAEFRKAWKQKASANAWPTAAPEKPAHEISADIGTQYMMMSLFAIAAVWLFAKWFLNRGIWVEGDETLIRNSSGQELKISEIIKINKKKWDEKGLAYIHYQDGNRKRKFVMDDYKFDEDAMGTLMEFAEAHLKPEQIIGGRSQKQIASDKAKKEAEREQRRAERRAAAQENSASEPDDSQTDAATQTQ